jgi:glycosyltransferase involved in cell wall biosynthesis
LPITRDEFEHFSWADTIFVDWCDNNAVWTIMHAPRSARIVVRIHSIDALSPHPHLVDWSKVSDVIFVGDHIRTVVTQAVPDLPRHAATHVVPNLLRLDRFDLPKNSTADRTLAMVGWAQRVKDPIFALEVLARLRQVDETWRLMLVGRDFPLILRGSEARYRDVYRLRALADDVRDAVKYVAYTPKLADVFCAAGFILSCSRRESQGVALIEGAASAAVPVVRNWPMFASYDAARSVFPADWVVDTPAQAVERILAHADPQVRQSAGAAARGYVMKRYDQSVVAQRLFEILVH